MKKLHIQPLFGLLMLVLISCGPSKAEKELKQQEDLAKEVLDIHDEVMPKTGELVKLRKQLKEKVNSWTENSAENNTENIQKATILIADLDAADQGMMDWMHAYNGGQGLYDHEAIIQYLNEEKTKVTTVKEKMNTSMEAAKQFLENNK